jgi:hypothetical protein
VRGYCSLISQSGVSHFIDRLRGAQFGENFEPEKAGLVGDEQRLNLLVDEFLDPATNDANENGMGKTFGFHVHGGGQLVVGLENGTARGGGPKRVVLGVMKPA